MGKEQITLDDYSKLISDATVRFAAARVAEDLHRGDALADMLYMGYTPPTRLDRVRYWFKDKAQRARDIWIILSGGDIHENCGY